MAIVKMKKLRVMTMASQRDELLRGLLHLGCVEISEPDMEQLPDSLQRCDSAVADCLAQ